MAWDWNLGDSVEEWRSPVKDLKAMEELIFEEVSESEGVKTAE